MELLTEKKIKIGDKEYSLKKSNRAMIEFEKLSGKSITQLSSIEDGFYFFYCCFKAGGNNYTFEEFMNLIDDYGGILNEFSTVMGGGDEEKKNPAQ